MMFPQAQLGDHVDVVGGFAFKSETFAQEGIPVIRISDIQEGAVSVDKAAKIPVLNIGKGARFTVEPGDILIAMSGATTGKIGLAPQNLTGCVLQNQRVGNFKIKNPEKILKVYLKHFVCSATYQNQVYNLMAGAAQPNISSSQLESITVPVPPLPEQRRIAAILDQADALRAKRREALAQLDSLTQSIFIEMFGDPVTNSKRLPTKSLNQITTFENGDRSGNYPSGDDIKEDGVLFLSTKNITAGRLDLTKSVYITEEKFDSLSRGKVRRNDVVITLRGTLGSCCIFDTVHETAFINAQMMIIRPGPECNSTYLHALLTSQQAQERFDHIGRGAAVPQLTSAQMAGLKIPVPSLADQQEFARRKKSLDELKDRQERSMAGLDTLFASLQHRAFRGEL